MGYIQDLEKELKEMLTDLTEARQREIIKFIKEKVLESYRNGLTASQKARGGRKSRREG